MKKIVNIMIVMSLLLVFSACSTVIADTGIDHSGETLTGMISQIEGSALSLDLGKVKENEMEMGKLPQGQMSEENGEMPQFPAMGQEGQPDFENGERPELPPMEGNNQMPQGGMPFGQDQMNENEDSLRPQIPGTDPGNGDAGEFPPMGSEMSDFENGERPEFPEGMNENGFDPFDGQLGPTMSYTFKKGKETTQIDIADAAVTLADGSIGTVGDLEVGDVVVIVVDQNNQIESVTVYNISE